MQVEPTMNLGKWEVIFLGTGSSSSVPRLKCKIIKKPEIKCACIQEPFNPKNHRLNPSILLKKRNTDKPDYHILVDMGKTFREGVLRHFENFNITSIDSIIITHAHCDAYGGLDDVRDLTDRIPGQAAIPVDFYADKTTMPHIQISFPYLFPALRDPSGPTAIGTLNDIIMEDFVPFNLPEMSVIPIPLCHGGKTRCTGFSFSHSPDSQVIYLSDFRHAATGPKNSHGVPEVTKEDYDNFTLFLDAKKTLALLKEKPVSVMVLDCLRIKNTTNVHATLPETLELIRSFQRVDINPEKIYLTGMDCSIDYPILKEELIKLGFNNTEPGFDGLSFSF